MSARFVFAVVGTAALGAAVPASAQILKDVLTPSAPLPQTAPLPQVAPLPATKVTNLTGHSLRAGQPVSLETAVELTSRSAAMGEMVPMRLAEDVVINGRVAIPRGTSAMGQVEDVRTKGYLGQRGKLAIRPLYLTHGSQTIRLTGKASSTGHMTAGAVIGIAIISGVFTGKSAVFPSGTKLDGVIMRDVIVAP